MGNAIWLLISEPSWYFQTIFNPFNGGPLKMIPVTGIICLMVGVFLAIEKRQLKLWLFAIPFVASELLVFVAGLCRGMCKYHADDVNTLIYVFFVLQLVGTIFLVVRLRGFRLSAALLAVFSVTYALFAAFTAGMSLTDTWI